MSTRSGSGAGTPGKKIAELIEAVAENTATAQEKEYFEQEALVDKDFRRRVSERKSRYRSEGHPTYADRLNAAMIVMMHKSLCEDDATETDDVSRSAFRQDGQPAESAGENLHDTDGVFYVVADGTATIAQRLLFSTKLMQSQELYRRVSNTQMMWASLPSQLAQSRAGRLQRVIELCDRRRNQIQNDATSREKTTSTGNASDTGPSRMTAPQRSAPKADVPARIESGGNSATGVSTAGESEAGPFGGAVSGIGASRDGASGAGPSTNVAAEELPPGPSGRAATKKPEKPSSSSSGTKSCASSSQDDEEVDLIEVVASRAASKDQIEAFIRHLKHSKPFQHQALIRDRSYIASHTAEGYMKAATLRITTAHEGDMALANLFPWNPHVVEGIHLAEQRLGIDPSRQANIPQMLADEMQLLSASSAVEARQEELRNRRRLKVRKNAAGGETEAMRQSSVATTSNRAIEAGPSSSSGSRGAATENRGGEAGTSYNRDSQGVTTSNRGGEAGPSSSGGSSGRGGRRPPTYPRPFKPRASPRSAATSQAPPPRSRGAAGSGTSFQPLTDAGSPSRAQEDAPKPFIVSENAMEQLHDRFREDRAAEPQRGRRKTSRNRASRSEQQ